MLFSPVFAKLHNRTDHPTAPPAPSTGSSSPLNSFALNLLQTHRHNGITATLLKSIRSALFSARRRVTSFKPKILSSCSARYSFLVTNRPFFFNDLQTPNLQSLCFQIYANWSQFLQIYFHPSPVPSITYKLLLAQLFYFEDDAFSWGCRGACIGVSNEEL